MRNFLLPAFLFVVFSVQSQTIQIQMQYVGTDVTIVNVHKDSTICSGCYTCPGCIYGTRIITQIAIMGDSVLCVASGDIPHKYSIMLGWGGIAVSGEYYHPHRLMDGEYFIIKKSVWNAMYISYYNELAEIDKEILRRDRAEKLKHRNDSILETKINKILK